MSIVNARASMRWRIKHPEHRMWIGARARARRKGIKFSISVSDVVIPERCPVFGTVLHAAHGRGRRTWDDSPSLDRINNHKGYEPGNVAVISGRANKLKNAGSAEEHRRIAEWMEDHFSGKGLI